MIARRFGRARAAALAAALACFCLPAPAAADPAEEAYQTAASMAAALAEDNPAAFLRCFDSAMPGLGALRDKVRALIARAELSSSIDVLENAGDAARRTLVLDWYLEARSREIGQATERRRVRVTIVLNHAGKAWKAVSMDAGGLFD